MTLHPTAPLVTDEAEPKAVKLVSVDDNIVFVRDDRFTWACHSNGFSLPKERPSIRNARPGEPLWGGGTYTPDTPSGGFADRCGDHPEPAVFESGSPDAFLDRDWTAGEAESVRAKLAAWDGERGRALAVDRWLWNRVLRHGTALFTEYLNDPAAARARAAAEMETE